MPTARVFQINASSGGVPKQPVAISEVTANGQKMYIGRGPEIWVLDRIDGGWGNDRKVTDGMRPWTDRKGNLYLTENNRQNGSSTLVVYRPSGVGFQEMEPLPTIVNDPRGGAHPLISLDGNTLVFDSFRTDEQHPNEYGDFFVCRQSLPAGF